MQQKLKYHFWVQKLLLQNWISYNVCDHLYTKQHNINYHGQAITIFLR